MKSADRLQFYRDEVTRSKKWRSDTYDPTWHRLIDLYRGKQYQQASRNDQLIINLAFATKNVIAPSVAINNPRFVVNSRKPENAANAVVVEEVLNYLWRCYRYQDEVRLAVDDWIDCGHGWIKTGYKFVKEPVAKASEEQGDSNVINEGAAEGIDDRVDTEGNVETEMEVRADRPFLERISMFDMFVDPDARRPGVMRWIAQRTWRSIQDVRVDERYDTRARKRVSSTTSYLTTSGDGDNDGRGGLDMPDAGSITYCEVIEFYDLKRREVCTFALDGPGGEEGTDASAARDLFLIKPAPIPYGFGHPFKMLRNYEIPDTFYPIGELEQIESLQLELNETRNQMLNHRKRFARKWIYARDAFDEDGVRALESDVDNTMIPTIGQDNPANFIAPLPSIGTPPDFYNQSQLIEEDINTVSGVSDYQRGSPEANIRRTATEAAMIQDAANARARDKLAKVESFLSEVGEAIVMLMQQFMTGEAVARITTVAGRAWVNYDSDYLQGAFDFEVEGGSTEPRNEAFRRQSALQLVDSMAPFIEIGVVNPMGLARYVLQYGFGIKDVSTLLNDPQTAAQQQAQMTGQAPPGGAPPEQGDPMAQQMPAEGMGPPIEQMPQGGPQIPPELMAQLGGGAGAMGA
jgi:hypothetical protein